MRCNAMYIHTHTKGYHQQQQQRPLLLPVSSSILTLERLGRNSGVSGAPRGGKRVISYPTYIPSDECMMMMIDDDDIQAINPYVSRKESQKKELVVVITNWRSNEIPLHPPLLGR